LAIVTMNGEQISRPQLENKTKNKSVNE